MSLNAEINKLKNKFRVFGQRVENEVRQGIKKIALHTLKRLIQETPRGHTGQLKKSWKMTFNGNGRWSGFEVANSSKIMRFIEHGTKAHGPRRAKFLFVPLTKKASMGQGKKLKFGKDYVLAKKVSGIKGLKIINKRQRIVTKMGNKLKLRVKQILGETFNG